jgi:hypothetical protein
MRESAPPFLESTVTFTVVPNGTGGTSLRIIHELDGTSIVRMMKAANSNSPICMRAAA